MTISKPRRFGLDSAEPSRRGVEWKTEEGHLHREGGPAIELDNGDKWWCIDGKFHKEDGPAIESDDEDKGWYINGRRINCSTQEEFERLMKLELFW